MGDRANIVILQHRPTEDGKGKTERIYLYSHWGGHEIAQKLQTALRKRIRWNDEHYLGRIIFETMIEGAHSKETGFGISTFLCDNEHNILVVDAEAKPEPQVIVEKEGGKELRRCSFEDFCKKTEEELEVFHDGGR